MHSGFALSPADFGESSSGIGSVVEYAHGATSPTKTLDTDGAAQGCSVSPNGDLAVSNLDRQFGSETGDVQVWKNASGTPTEYVSDTCAYVWAPGYDRRGNLYVEGVATLFVSNETSVCELPVRGQALRTVQVNRTIGYASGVAWDGKHVVLSDQSYSDTTALYQTTEARSGDLKVVKTMVLRDTHCRWVGLLQPFVVGIRNTPANRQEGHTLIGGNISCDYRFLFWKYPGEGVPFNELAGAPELPEGQSVSIAP